MPPAFNLSQDQTLQFNACYCFLFFRIGRSLNVLTIDHPVRKQENLSFHYCVRLDTFASAADPGVATRTRRASPSSAHTYRLLVFKDRFANSSLRRKTSTTGTASFCVAASAAEKRDYEEHLQDRQQFF
jgi:hypothetical protein